VAALYVAAPKPLLRLGLRLLSESSAKTHPAQIDPEAGKEDNGYQLAEHAGLLAFQAPLKTIPDLEIEVRWRNSGRFRGGPP
jgi:hypothetical protein